MKILKALFKKHENKVEYFYKDSRGNMTIGIGHMVPNAEAAKNLPLYLHDAQNKPLREATEDEKISAFSRVQKSTQRKFAFEYEPLDEKNKDFLNLRLQDGDMEFMLEQRLREVVNTIQRRFPDFEKYPSPARKALQDMEFNLGPSRFQEHKWSGLFDAVRKNN